MNVARAQHELARYELPGGTQRVLCAQRINGRVAISDIPTQGDGRVYLVERHIESQAAMHALAHAYVTESIERGEPAILVPRELTEARA